MHKLNISSDKLVWKLLSETLKLFLKIENYPQKLK
jgi:hypothetical protein